MIRAAYICPDSDLRGRLEKTLGNTRGVYVTRRLSYYPDDSELVRLLQTNAPDLLFVSMEVPEQALHLARCAASAGGKLETVAITRQQTEQLLLSMMKAGVRHVLNAPFEDDCVGEIVRQMDAWMQEQRASACAGEIYSFLPAKPGSGTSILALNTTLALARSTDRLALLMDCDFNLGVIGALLGLPPGPTVFDAANDAVEPEDGNWSRRIASLDGIHVLPSGGLNPGLRIELAQLRHLLEFVRRTYTDICVDLSGNMETYSIELLQESRKIVLVTSLDPLAAQLAVKKMGLLARLELTDRVVCVATRTTERDWLPVGQFERALGREVDIVVAYDRAAVRTAIEAREPVEPRSSIGKQCAEIARRLAQPSRTSPLAGLKRTFLEHFTLSPSR